MSHSSKSLASARVQARKLATDAYRDTGSPTLSDKQTKHVKLALDTLATAILKGWVKVERGAFVAIQSIFADAAMDQMDDMHEAI